ncbi:hypothetical protein D3C87_1591890 [compost metagenome]
MVGSGKSEDFFSTSVALVAPMAVQPRPIARQVPLPLREPVTFCCLRVVPYVSRCSVSAMLKALSSCASKTHCFSS